MAEGMCSAGGCERYGWIRRGLCDLHYQRWRRSATELPRCSVDGCDRPHYAKGWCEKHYSYWRRVGEPGPAEREIGYAGLHYRLRTSRGNAAGYPCQRCGQQAAHWAYDHDDPAERHDLNGWAYSMDLGHYMPLCSPCHVAFDKR